MARGSRSRPGQAPVWTPFPVQDWNAYARTQGWRSSRVGTRTLTLLLALLVVAAGGVLVAIDLPAVLAADRRPPYVSADGDQHTAELTLGGAAGTGTAAAVVSSSVLPAPVTSQLLPFDLGSILLGAVDGRLETRVWRRMTTTATGTRYELYGVGDGVQLLAGSHPRLQGFAPDGVALLPTGVAPGDRWSDQGTVIPGAQRWRSELTAADAGAGCLVVTGTLTIGEAPTALEQRWCPDTGLESQRSAGPDGELSEIPAPPPAGEPTTVDAVGPDLPAVDAWRETTFTPAERLPDPAGTVGSQAMTGIATGDPQPTTSRDLVVGSSGDLVVLRGSADTWTVHARIHPGGALLGWRVFGDVLLASTADRRLSAYDTRTARRLWALDLPDTTHARLLRFDAGTAAIGLTSGELITVGLTDGVVTGRADVRPGQSPPMAVVDGEAAVITRDGNVALLRGRELATVWEVEPPDVADEVLISTGRVWARTALGLEGYDRADGRYLWHRAHPGTGVVGALPAGLVQSVAGTVTLIDPDGRPAWSLPYGCEDLRPVGTQTLGCLRPDRVVWLDTAGRELAALPVPEHSQVTVGWAPRTDGVVLRTSGGWRLTGWGP